MIVNGIDSKFESAKLVSLLHNIDKNILYDNNTTNRSGDQKIFNNNKNNKM